MALILWMVVSVTGVPHQAPSLLHQLHASLTSLMTLPSIAFPDSMGHAYPTFLPGYPGILWVP